MKDEIMKQLAQEGLTILRGTKQFAVAQAPDFIRQILLWQLISEIVQVVFCLLIIGLVVWGSVRFWKHVGRPGGDPDVRVLLIFDVFLLLPLMGVANGLTKSLQIYFAPKVFLLEYFTHLLK